MCVGNTTYSAVHACAFVRGATVFYATTPDKSSGPRSHIVQRNGTPLASHQNLV